MYGASPILDPRNMWRIENLADEKEGSLKSSKGGAPEARPLVRRGARALEPQVPFSFPAPMAIELLAVVAL